MTTSDTEINWGEIAEESDPRFGGVKIKTASKKALRIKVSNRDPKNPDAFQPGLIVKDGDTKTACLNLHAVILLVSHNRSLFTKNKGLVCSSDDGHSPSLKHKEPQCKKCTAADVAKVLKTFRNMDEARLTDLTGQLTENSDKLAYCGIAKDDGTLIPICPMARKDELGNKGPCTPVMTLAGVDLSTGRKFYLQATGQSIRRDKESVSPLWRFLETLGEKGVPTYNVSIELAAVKADNGFYLLDVRHITPLSPEERKVYKVQAEKELESQTRRMCTAGKPLEEKSKEEQAKDKIDEVYGDDDIQF